MFPVEYINEGRVTNTATSVSVWSDRFHSKNLNNIPCGHVQTAFWQGNNIHVIMEDGWHYIYQDFGGHASKWR
jgi:hypothetical protein